MEYCANSGARATPSLPRSAGWKHYLGTKTQRRA
jgi:hypothetical protein